MDSIVLQKLGLEVGPTPEMKPWKDFLTRKENVTQEVNIGLVGKYVELQDAYKSIDESLQVAAVYNNRKLNLRMIQSEKINGSNVAEILADLDGILIAPGFGMRGIDGKIAAIKYIREHDIPCLGIGLGMQCMIIEFARNVLGWPEANSTEFDAKTPNNVIDLMEDYKNVNGSMRLGAFDCVLAQDSKIYQAYGKKQIQERHRHRYEFNTRFKPQFEASGMKCTGENPETQLVEAIEIPSLKWFIGVIYHPEYNSTVISPNPLFISLVKAAIEAK
ncbi:MAG: CTP synthase, partial [Tannerella sp.]|jgi:CTP synthase|nr:CTP synthase [Tannerella sp.]